MPEFTVGEKSFPSKKACSVYLKDISKMLPIGPIDKDWEHLPFILDLLSKHPLRYISQNAFKLKLYYELNEYRVPVYNYTLSGGQKWKVSLQECITKHAEYAIYNRDKELLMRKLVEDQIAAFRAENEEICARCNLKRRCQVDHSFPTFAQLKHSFKESGDQCTGVEKDRSPNPLFHLRFFNPDTTIAWKEYHLENSNLQFLCKTCHQMKTNEQR